MIPEKLEECPICGEMNIGGSRRPDVPVWPYLRLLARGLGVAAGALVAMPFACMAGPFAQAALAERLDEWRREFEREAEELERRL